MTLSALLSTLTESVNSALSSVPDTTILQSPAEGISLLDTKNELLLSYLQNLVFLIILKLRNRASSDVTTPPYDIVSDDDVVRNLVTLRTYIEKGVRPLESRLKYQIDKLLFAASEESARPDRTEIAVASSRQNHDDASNGVSTDADEEDNPSNLGNSITTPTQISDLAHRPNPSSLLPPSRRPSSGPSNSVSNIYRPPHITPTSLPTHPHQGHDKKPTRPRNSHTLDEFIREEMGDAPLAQPSIGSGTGLRGKAAEREKERRGYEEGRLVRLPGEKKKKERRGGEGFGEDDFGGEGIGIGGLRTGKGKRERERREEVMGERWEKRRKMGAGKGMGKRK